MKISIFWFRRDLRLMDNTALNLALSKKEKVLPLFIFDEQILDELPIDDARISFIHETLSSIDKTLQSNGSSLLCLKGDPESIWKKLIQTYSIDSVYVNKDYEPYAIQRDQTIAQLLTDHNIPMILCKDQVIHEESDVMKKDGTPYTVFTPYKNQWLQRFEPTVLNSNVKFEHFHKHSHPFPSLPSMGFTKSKITVVPYQLDDLDDYSATRDFPNKDSTSYLSPHLRFGTVSIREVVYQVYERNPVFLSELIWREFFMQILFHFPHVVTQNFRSKYDGIQWRNNMDDFENWCNGTTGYPMVDAGMRQLNKTGYMHNRVRMITAGFLCKHLLIDWRLGEAYFAKKLLDFELSSNNGNWQWAAGTGCDAAPYFRIFNPITQLKKFDPSHEYVKKWIAELETDQYATPMVDHKMARIRALETYKKGINR